MTTTTNLSALPFDEKYRPRTPEDLFGQEEPLRLFREHVDNDFAPAFLLHGPPGVGKTCWGGMMGLARSLIPGCRTSKTGNSRDDPSDRPR